MSVSCLCLSLSLLFLLIIIFIIIINIIILCLRNKQTKKQTKRNQKNHYFPPFFLGSRNDPNVKREVLILTDGKSNCGPNAVQAAKGLQQVADVYALVIGSPASKDQREIESYVSQPVSSHLFATPNFQDLTLLVTEVLHQIHTHPNVSCMSFNP